MVYIIFKRLKTIYNNSRNKIWPKLNWLWCFTRFFISFPLVNNFHKWFAQCSPVQCCTPFCRWYENLIISFSLIIYSLKNLNKHISRDLELVNEWICANKLSLNVKTEIIIFKPKNKYITKCLNFWLSGQKVKLNKQVKYLGVILQDDLHWNSHLFNLKKNWAMP